MKPIGADVDTGELPAVVEARIDGKIEAAVADATTGAVPTTRTVNGHPLSANVTVTKSDIGLGSVDNTQQQPLDADLTAIAALDSTTSGAIASDGSGWVKKTYAQFKTALSLTKSDVGLGNVDNTSDANKPVSTAQQTALDLKANASTARRTYTATDLTRNNTTSYLTIASLSIAAGTKYLIRGAINFDGAQAADIKVRCQATSSTGASGWFGLIGPNTSATSTTATSINSGNAQTIATSGGSAVSLGAVGVGTAQMAPLSGYVVGGSVGGTLELMFSQNSADLTDLTVRAGSWLELIEVP